MINHARSLLLNSQPTGRPELGQYGEEYIPTQYRVLEYTPNMQAIRSAMLGVMNDPLFQNYRLAQLMGCLHANPYTLGYCLGLDSRFTYLPFEASFTQFDQAVVVEPVNELVMTCGADGTALTDETSGRAIYRYNLETATGPTLRIFDYASEKTTVQPITLVGTVSDPIPLNSQLTVRLNVPGGSWRAGAQWTVTAIATPSSDLSTVLVQIAAMPAAVAELSATATTSFVQLWRYGVAVVEQLAGVTAMLVEAAERIRRG